MDSDQAVTINLLYDLNLWIIPSYLTSWRVICATHRPHLTLNGTLEMQSTKCQSEGRHKLAPFGRKHLTMNNSEIRLILFPEDVSLACSCLHKGQLSPC